MAMARGLGGGRAGGYPRPTMNHDEAAHLVRIAEEEMRRRGFEVELPLAALAEAAALHEPQPSPEHPDAAAAAVGGGGDPLAGLRDLTALPWSSIDNPESRDLDQIEYAERTAAGYRLLVGIADVAAEVPAGSAIDRHAADNAVSVYTGVRTFALLPERLCYQLTSLLEDRPRRAVVIETLIDDQGGLGAGTVYPALVQNHARLDYPHVSAWLDGRAGPPAALAERPRVAEQVRLHDEIAGRLRAARKREGALDVGTAETRAQVDEQGRVVAIVPRAEDRASQVVEELMIASNRSAARSLDRGGLPSLRRVVRRPERWPRIVAYAAERGVALPPEPDPLALSRFADRMRIERPDEYAEISLALVKLIGRGEYVAHAVGEPEPGHFGLAATRYTHATAPNRRYADLITQRLLKALAAGQPSPITVEELARVAARCSAQTAAAERVARRVQKSAAAALLSGRVGQDFEGIITGVTDKGVFVRALDPVVEGKVVRGERGLAVGDRVPVRLLATDVQSGFIDFEALPKVALQAAG
jgi:exoribonuclease-2